MAEFFPERDGVQFDVACQGVNYSTY